MHIAHIGQASKKEREIHFAALQRGKHIGHQFIIAFLLGLQAQLGTHFIQIGRLKKLGKALQFVNQGAVGHQRQQAGSQPRQVPMHHIRLLVIRIAPGRVGMVGHMAAVVSIEKAERAVIDGEAERRHIVGVEHTVAKAHALPGRHQFGAAAGDFLKQGEIRVFGRAAFGEMACNQKIGQRRQLLVAAGVIKIFEMAEADKARRNAGNNRGGFRLFAIHRIVAAGERQRPRGGNAQAVHGFGAQIFAYRRAQHRAAVGKARIRRFARAFELPFPRAALRIARLTQKHGAPVAQLAHIHAELVAAIHRSNRRGIIMRGTAAQISQHAIVEICKRHIDFGGQHMILRHPIRRMQRLGRHAAVKSLGQARKSGRMQGKNVCHFKQSFCLLWPNTIAQRFDICIGRLKGLAV